MLELILSTLAEFGLIREDFKHRKRISKKEKEDGTKRPIQKYLLQPSSIMVISLLVVISISSFLFFGYQTLLLIEVLVLPTVVYSLSFVNLITLTSPRIGMEIYPESLTVYP